MKENKKFKPEAENRGGNWVADKLDSLAPESTPPIQIARTRLDSLISKKENTMWHKIFGPKYRTVWVTLGVIGVLAISLSIPQVRVIANSFLGLFRVEQIEAVDVGVSLESLPDEMETNFRAVDNLIGDQLSVDKVVQPIEVADISEAGALAGLQARMPSLPEGETHIYYQDSSAVRLVIDQERWQALLDAMGHDDFIIPKSADGAEVVINIPSGVIVAIGDCQFNEIDEVKLGHPDTEDCTVFLQSTSPTIEAPPGVDINRAGQILLRTLGMSASEAEEFSATVNWATTLVVPVPSDVEYRHITVEGVDAIFLEDELKGGKAVYTLLWLKDGMLQALIGDGTQADALRLVNSLE
jgi:hypothetical protein